MKYLEVKFVVNEAARQPLKGRVKKTVDLTLLKNKNLSVPGLIKVLEKDGINTVLLKNDKGLIYGLTYVDHKTKCVFNGSDLGKQYSARGIQERCNHNDQSNHNEIQQNEHPTKQQGLQIINPTKEQVPLKKLLIALDINKAVDELIQPTQGGSYVPHQFKKRKKKKGKNISNNS